MHAAILKDIKRICMFKNVFKDFSEHLSSVLTNPYTGLVETGDGLS